MKQGGLLLRGVYPSFCIPCGKISDTHVCSMLLVTTVALRVLTSSYGAYCNIGVADMPVPGNGQGSESVPAHAIQPYDSDDIGAAKRLLLFREFYSYRRLPALVCAITSKAERD